MMFVYFIAIVFSADLYVSLSGTDTDTSGSSRAQPFRSISFAISKAKAGDSIWLLEGRYEVEKLIFDGLDKISISALPDNEVVLDGTREIATVWTQLESDNRIWTTSPDFPVWQLFLSGSMVGLARFPNAVAFSEDSWDRFKWREQAPGSSEGVMKDLARDCEPEEQTLAGLGRSLNGCVATLNIGHWVSVSSVVSGHSAGSDTFNYVNDRDWWFTDGHYMIEGLAALDAPGEWGYDWESNTLYLWPEDEVNPNDVEVRGKTQDYLMFVTNAQKFSISDVTFFGGGLKFNNVVKSVVENVVFDHPSYNMRALGRAERAPTALLMTRPYSERNTASRNIVRGCTFKFTDGAALEIQRGYGDAIDHNTFLNIDYSAAYATGAVDFLKSIYTRFRYNYVDTTGSSETVRVGMQSTIKYNLFKNGGLLQEDGAALQVPIVSQEGTVIYRNWAIDNGKLGFRFDTPHMNGDMGSDGEMTQNVAFNNRRGLSVKADNHLIQDNTAVMNSWHGHNDIIVYTDNLGQAQWQYNLDTVTRGNLAGSISGTSKGDTPLNNPGDNWTPANAMNLLRDPRHGDFRPRDRTQYGAYKSPRQRNYWIPGPRHETKATYPLPENRAQDVPADVDLKFQVCRDGCTYDVFFGTDKDDLQQVAQGITTNVIPIDELEVGLTYFWRVDTENGEGDVWQFTVGPDFVFDGASSGCGDDLSTIVSEIDSLRVALNQNGWTDWCEKDAIRDLYEESSVLKTYTFAECTDAQCGRDRMQNPVCDLKYVASTVLGRTPWLGHIASDLNEPHCFGGSCGLPEGDSTDETFTTPSEEISWDTCNFSMLFADAQALYSIIGTKGAWGDNEACTDDDVRSVYENSAVLSQSMCVESEVLEVSALVSNEWFGTLVSEIRGCYGTD